MRPANAELLRKATLNRGTGVPPVITAETAVPRKDYGIVWVVALLLESD